MPKNKKTNRWHTIILEVLRAAAPESRATNEILDEMTARGFKHGSENPKATLGGRLAELHADGLVKRVGRAQYSIKQTAPMLTPEQVQGSPLTVESIERSMEILREAPVES